MVSNSCTHSAPRPEHPPSETINQTDNASKYKFLYLLLVYYAIEMDYKILEKIRTVKITENLHKLHLVVWIKYLNSKP